MLITLSRRTSFCQSVAQVQLTNLLATDFNLIMDIISAIIPISCPSLTTWSENLPEISFKYHLFFLASIYDA